MSDHERHIGSTDDLLDTWRMIDGGFGYSAPQLFAFHVEADGRFTQQIMHVYDDEFDGALDDEFLDTFVSIQEHILGTTLPGGSLAVMRARPGSASMTPDDLRVCQRLHRHLSNAPFATWPVVFATDHSVGVIPPDDLIESAAS